MEPDGQKTFEHKHHGGIYLPHSKAKGIAASEKLVGWKHHAGIAEARSKGDITRHPDTEQRKQSKKKRLNPFVTTFERVE